MSFKNTIVRTFNKTKNFVSHHSPVILVGAGIVAMGGALYSTYKATRKLDAIMAEKDEMLATVEDKVKDEVELETSKNAVMVKTAGKLALNYAPAAALTALSITCFIGSNKILTKRYKTLYGSYIAVTGAFAAYRNRVVDQLGVDADNKFMYGAEVKKITIENEDGSKEKKEVTVVDEDNIYGVSEYARWYDEDTTAQWNASDFYNKDYIKNTEHWLRDMAILHGKVTLNEAYSMLGFQHTYKGQAVGWSESDDIQIKIMEVARKSADGKYESAILVDFNPVYILDQFKDTRFIGDGNNAR